MILHRTPKATWQWLAFVLASVLAATGLRAAADELPRLEVRLGGGHGVWLEMPEVGADDGWILQDTYDGVNWRDLRAYPGEPVRDTLARRPLRLFRGVRKPLDSHQAALNRARQQWQSLELTDYQYAFGTSGEFGEEEQLVAVRDGNVFDHFIIQAPPFWDSRAGDRIDQVFDRIQAAIDQEAEVIIVLYHPTLGYPESIFIDYSALIADEEWSWELTEAPRRLPDVLTENEQRWRQHAGRNYRYHLAFDTAWWRWEGEVEVIDGVASPVGSIPTSDHIIRTIEEHFAYLRDAYAEASDVAAWFDPADGFPAFMSKNWIWTFIDGPGEHYRITELQWID